MASSENHIPESKLIESQNLDRNFCTNEQQFDSDKVGFHIGNTQNNMSNKYESTSHPALHTFKKISIFPRSQNIIQPKLKLNIPGDKYEQEADQIAERVVGNKPADIQRKCLSCNKEEEETIQTKRLRVGPETVDNDLSGQIRKLKGGGRSLDPLTRAFMESRFQLDFQPVRIHTSAKAEELNKQLGSRAFTTGSDIFFNRNEFNPGTIDGLKLLAHELTHSVQQGFIPYHNAHGENHSTNNRISPSLSSAPQDFIQRASYQVGNITINVDYGNIVNVNPASYVSTIEGMYTSFTSAPDASAIHSDLVSLSQPQQKWVLFALDLLIDNTHSPDHNRLNRLEAVQRLINFAPSATHSIPSGGGADPEIEALRAAGWFEIALSSNLSAPTASDTSAISTILNPPTSGGPGAALNVAEFHRRMEAGIRHLLTAVDPANWSSTGTRSLSTLQSLGDVIMDEAKEYFHPYAHTARTSVFALSPTFHISSNIFSVTSQSYSNPTRRSYLRNRAGLVGRNSTANTRFPDTDIFSDVNYNGSDPSHRAELDRLITTLLNDPAIVGITDRLLKTTGRQSGSGASTSIGLSTEYDASSTSDCEARWEIIDTLCHEVIHALAHPDFETAAARQGEPRILIEGFTEVLGVELYQNHIKPKAIANPSFKATMESGIPACPATPPHTASVGYGAYGSGAERILNLSSISSDQFKAAFFLGQVHLIGL